MNVIRLAPTYFIILFNIFDMPMSQNIWITLEVNFSF